MAQFSAQSAAVPDIEQASATVAVITRTKDRPLLLKRAAASVAGQRFHDLQWIVVNDGGSAAPVDEIVADTRRSGLNAHVIHHPTSRGMEAASNRGIAASRSEFIVIHDDDDSWAPAYLNRTVAFLREQTHYGGVICHSTKVTERIENEVIRVTRREPYNKGLATVALADMAAVNSFPPISFLFRRASYDAVGGFDESLRVLGDWDFNLRFLLAADIAVIPEPLAFYHHREATDRNRSYGNTVVDGVDLHLEYDTLLRNRMLRADLAAGRVGLGVLAALARQDRLLKRDLNPLVRVSNLLLQVKRAADPRRWFRD